MSDMPLRPTKRLRQKQFTLKSTREDAGTTTTQTGSFRRGRVISTTVEIDLITTPPAHLRPYLVYLKHAQLPQRVRIERDGVPSQVVEELIDEVGISTGAFQAFIGIPPATYKKRVRENGLFSGASGQSVVGWMDLINKVEDMLAAESDNEAARDFDVAAWVGNWIQRPQKALGGVAPAELMDTPSGRESVMRVLGAIQSGAYL